MTENSNSVAPSRHARKTKARKFTPEEEDEIRAAYNYDHHTGIFTWKRSLKYSKARVGDVAGSINGDGRNRKYLALHFKGRKLKAHRVAFFLMTGRFVEGIDHIDCDPLNNRFENLREATHQENQRNKKAYRNNKVGYKGVIRDRRSGLTKRFRAEIRIDRKSISLGFYRTAEEAREAYLSAALFAFGEFVNLD